MCCVSATWRGGDGGGGGGVLKSVELGQHGGGQSVLGVMASGGSRLLRVLGERAGRD